MESNEGMGLILLIIGGFVLLFPLMWLGILFILSAQGWNNLARNFRTSPGVTGNPLGMRAFRINMVSYNAVVQVAVGPEGLYLQPIWIFHFFHPPLLIPWDSVASVHQRNMLLLKYQVLTIGSPRIARISVPAAWYQEIVPYLDFSH